MAKKLKLKKKNTKYNERADVIRSGGKQSIKQVSKQGGDLARQRGRNRVWGRLKSRVSREATRAVRPLPEGIPADGPSKGKFPVIG